MPELYSSVNKAVATIENCEDEPIHIPGSIQPNGFLLVIGKQSKLIELCSENTTAYLGQPPVYFLSKSYTETLPSELQNVFDAATNVNEQTPVKVFINNVALDCFRKESGEFIYLECVVSDEKANGIYELFSETNGLLSLIKSDTGLQKLCSIVAEQIRRIIGFDRVMIYQFDESDNGHVYAESVADGVESFLDLHYPSTDIPPQARALYLKNLIRLIADVDYTPVPVVTLKADLAKPENVDMSNVSLRSVSPIHITYLKNMEVGATFTISIIKDGRLWGLVACHHMSSKSIPYALQVQAYLVTQILSSQIGVQETAEKYAMTQQLDTPLKQLTELLSREENFVELHFAKLEAVRQVVNANGAALIYKGKVFVNGIVPPADFVLSLADWLHEKNVLSYHNHKLSEDFEPANAYHDTASGLIYQQVNKAGKIDLFWFRPSAEKEVAWAGNPHEQKSIQPLTPRQSFAIWKEIKKGTSEEWLEPELTAAFNFSHLLHQHIAHLLQHEEELRSRKLNDKLFKANKELENINWISTHDLKEPLRKIQIFASMLDSPQSMPGVDTIKQSIEKIRQSAKRMQQFIDDLMLYSKMSTTEVSYESVDLNKVIKQVLMDFKEETDQHLFELTTDDLPAIPASRFQIQQLFVNLIGNAIKFRKDNTTQQIKIGYSLVDDQSDETKKWHKITIADKGVGFSKTMVSSIFDLFKRGHSDQKFQGTGVGLTICRRIMENHGGKIEASGNEGDGATFTLCFPVQ